jgi:hypothetical protein
MHPLANRSRQIARVYRQQVLERIRTKMAPRVVIRVIRSLIVRLSHQMLLTSFKMKRIP